MWISYFPSIIDFSFACSVVREYTLYDFQVFKDVLGDLLSGLMSGFSWTIFHVQWRGVCVLLLDGLICSYFLGPAGLQSCFSLLFPSDLLPSCSTHYWNIQLLIFWLNVYFSLQFCWFLLQVFDGSVVSSIYIIILINKHY